MDWFRAFKIFIGHEPKEAFRISPVILLVFDDEPENGIFFIFLDWKCAIFDILKTYKEKTAFQTIYVYSCINILSNVFIYFKLIMVKYGKNRF